MQTPSKNRNTGNTKYYLSCLSLKNNSPFSLLIPCATKRKVASLYCTCVALPKLLSFSLSVCQQRRVVDDILSGPTRPFRLYRRHSLLWGYSVSLGNALGKLTQKVRVFRKSTVKTAQIRCELAQQPPPWPGQTCSRQR